MKRVDLTAHSQMHLDSMYSLRRVLNTQTHPELLIPALMSNRAKSKSRFNYTCTIGSIANSDIPQTVRLYAYNWTCHEIGSSPFVMVGKTFDLFSELKYTVVIKFNDKVYPPTFMYAGNQYGQNATGTKLPDPICYNSGGQQACETQFDCGKEVNMADFEGKGAWRATAIRIEEPTTEAQD